MFFSDFRSCLLGAGNRPSGPRGDTLKPKRNSEKMKLNVSRLCPHWSSSVFRRQSQNQPCAWVAINSRKGTGVKFIVEICFTNYSDLPVKEQFRCLGPETAVPARRAKLLDQSSCRKPDRAEALPTRLK